MPPPDLLREAVRARALPGAPRPRARAVAQAVATAGGDSVRAIVFFGSRRTGARPDAHSAYDMFVVTTGYRPFYDRLHAKGLIARPTLAAVLNRWLPPNQISIPARLGDGTIARAKCAVVDERAFRRGASLARKDHFMAGRLFQPTEIALAADEVAAESVLDALVAAHRATFAWVRPWLPPTFDAALYCRTLLRVSFSWEIRPEPAARVEALWEAQRGELVPTYEVLLESLREAGELLLAGEPGHYALARPPSSRERWRVSAFFRWSLVRATLRWAKYVVTFDDWLEFLLRKARRHTGQEFVLTDRERRLPLVFLWPRVIHYLRHKDGK
jgi:hypothetical protein